MDTETADAIMAATGRALCEHGYAGLTMQRIAEESPMTKAAIHYHFDTKEELLNRFLNHVTERFEELLACDASDPRERLDAFLDAIFTPAEDGPDDFPVALMELKAQSPYHERFRDRFLELDDAMRTIVARTVRAGVEEGHFDDADPDAVARHVVTLVNGGHARRIALGEEPVETRTVVERYLHAELGWTPEVVA